MATPPTPLHPAPVQLNGTINYIHGYAFLLVSQTPQWILLMFDNPFTGVLDLTRAAQTANVLQNSYPQGAPAQFNGILMTHLVNGQNRLVLHLC
jgi:hypothetical protein